MKCQGINIATARIHGLNRPPYYFDHKCFYAWGIDFSDSSTLFFNNLPVIKVGDTKEQGEIYCNQLKSNCRTYNGSTELAARIKGGPGSATSSCTFPTQSSQLFIVGPNPAQMAGCAPGAGNTSP